MTQFESTASVSMRHCQHQKDSLQLLQAEIKGGAGLIADRGSGEVSKKVIDRTTVLDFLGWLTLLQVDFGLYADIHIG